jgi:DNA-binding beta-propeller fold protein YncE
VAAFDARTGRLLGTVAVGAKPIGIVAPPGTGKVYVSNESDDTFSALRTATATPRWFDLPVGDQPSEVLATPNGRTAYLSIRGEDKIARLDPDRHLLLLSARADRHLGGPAHPLTVTPPGAAVGRRAPSGRSRWWCGRTG